MEYCSRGELFSYLLQNGVLADFQIKHMLSQLVNALVYLHGRNIAHRDIKPENILIDQDLNVKLADFCLCHSTSNQQMLLTPCGSPFYAPPEIISNIPYDGKKGDMWSLGVVVFTMATGALPWTETNQTQLLQQIVNADYVVPVTVSPNIRHLIQALMDPNPSKRPSAEEVKSLPWMQENFDYPFGKPKLSAKVLEKSFNSRASYGYNTPASATVNKKSLIVRPTVPAGKARTICTVELSPMIDIVRKVRVRDKFAKRHFFNNLKLRFPNFLKITLNYI
ncbi:CAMK family protein kinase [Trichomonas vaginalis G3]|uniref:CAMK family protein kinase n=1 Tax=Trichomonas vaginalis (strain ATCC PRA-98 / G3) TaxID=412133 RepID=A2F3L7_TRIV3|nr:CAMK family protein kinase [Trichomonas vaginalis G3]|eukprot:XP_001313414.1 CAMK family protein kinase [Trichomonas vaginalis G3]